MLPREGEYLQGEFEKLTSDEQLFIVGILNMGFVVRTRSDTHESPVLEASLMALLGKRAGFEGSEQEWLQRRDPSKGYTASNLYVGPKNRHHITRGPCGTQPYKGVMETQYGTFQVLVTRVPRPETGSAQEYLGCYPDPETAARVFDTWVCRHPDRDGHAFMNFPSEHACCADGKCASPAEPELKRKQGTGSMGVRNKAPVPGVFSPKNSTYWLYAIWPSKQNGLGVSAAQRGGFRTWEEAHEARQQRLAELGMALAEPGHLADAAQEAELIES